MVEFALVLPIFMLVLSGICDFGFMLYNRMTVINSAREGARAAAMVSNPAWVEDTAVGAARSAASGGGVTVSLGDVMVVCLETSASVTSPATIPCTTVKNGDSVSVKVIFTYKTFFPLAFGQEFPLNSTVQMVFDNLPS
jgi:Flp pilus assembly protein TadG